MYSGGRGRRIESSRLAMAKLPRPHLKQNPAGGMTEMAECKTLSSNPSSAKKKKNWGM
jgi:hypothetical protein